jgi:hypothetical protein
VGGGKGLRQAEFRIFYRTEQNILDKIFNKSKIKLCNKQKSIGKYITAHGF